MKKTFLILGLVTATPVAAMLPTAGYVSDYYYQECNNTGLSVPGAGDASLTGQKYVLNIIDSLNAGLTTYGPDAETDNIVSVDYITSTLPLLAESMECCLGGVVGADNECRACGTWSRESHILCMDSGQYWNGTTCATCPDGWICPNGTNGKVPCGMGYWCKNNIRTECENKIYRCPLINHTSEPNTIACDYAWTFSI